MHYVSRSHVNSTRHGVGCSGDLCDQPMRSQARYLLCVTYLNGMRIAVLCFGSLVCHTHSETTSRAVHFDGHPVKSRTLKLPVGLLRRFGNLLSLVIVDEPSLLPAPIWVARSVHTDLNDAIAELMARENCSRRSKFRFSYPASGEPVACYPISSRDSQDAGLVIWREGGDTQNFGSISGQRRSRSMLSSALVLGVAMPFPYSVRNLACASERNVNTFCQVNISRKCE